eukprot:725262-Rhodomonas_salina.1
MVRLEGRASHARPTRSVLAGSSPSVLQTRSQTQKARRGRTANALQAIGDQMEGCARFVLPILGALEGRPAISAGSIRHRLKEATQLQIACATSGIRTALEPTNVLSALRTATA